MNRLMKFPNYDRPTWFSQALGQLRVPSALAGKGLRLGLVVLSSLGVALAVIVSTYYVDNAKLLVGLVGGLAFVLLTMRWPEFGILSLVALLSGLISLGSLPLLHLGPVSLSISDIMLMLLLGLVFLRATAQPGFKLFGSPLMLPLCLFIGAFLLSGVNGVINGVGFNSVLRFVRTLISWIMFIPCSQLIRNEKSLRRFLTGLIIFSGILALGVVFTNKFSPLLYMDEVPTGTGFTRIYYAGNMILYAMIPVTVASLATIEKGKQWWRIILLGLLFYWAYRTYFRTYWLSLAVVCALLIVFLSGQERVRLLKRMAPAIVTIVVVVGTLMLTQPTKVERITQPLSDRLVTLANGKEILQEGSLQWRVIESRYALEEIYRHPVLGIGLANKYRPPMQAESDQYSYGWASTYIENGYLLIALSMGLVGLIPFLWLCVAYLFRIYQHQREIKNNYLRAIYLGFGAGFLGQIATNFFSPSFSYGSHMVFFPVSMAITDIILRIEREKRLVQ